MTQEIDRIELENEKEALEEFLHSVGYHAAQKVFDAEIQDGIDVLVDYEDDNPMKVIRVLLEARGEVRALRKFRTRFIDRLNEIKDILEKLKPVKEE